MTEEETTSENWDFEHNENISLKILLLTLLCYDFSDL